MGHDLAFTDNRAIFNANSTRMDQNDPRGMLQAGCRSVLRSTQLEIMALCFRVLFKDRLIGFGPVNAVHNLDTVFTFQPKQGRRRLIGEFVNLRLLALVGCPFENASLHQQGVENSIVD